MGGNSIFYINMYYYSYFIKTSVGWTQIIKNNRDVFKDEIPSSS